MKRIIFWLFVIMVSGLNWAALHDILKGEPNVWMEWTFVIASLLLLSSYLFRKLRETKFH